MAYHHHYHHIDSAEDEARLLKHIIQLETQVRAKRERERLSANSESDRYSKIFEPITQSMKSIHDAVTGTTEVTPRKRARSSTATSTDDDHNNRESGNDDNGDQEISKGLEKEEEEEGEVVKKGEEKDDDPAAMGVQHVLSTIKPNQRDDGVFGLNWAKKTIGAYRFQVDGDNLQVQTGDNQWEIFRITMDDVWKMLLLQNPANKVHTKTSDGGLTPAAEQYKDIVQKLDLVQHAQKTKSGYKKRVKYKDIIAISASSGKGFFYSLQQPSSFINKRKKTGSGMQNNNRDGSPPPLSPCRQTKKKKRLQKFSPDTVVIPSDKKGLLFALVRAMAELKAGNTSMRNLVVPLALEAKRRGILPKEYSNDVDNLNWIYA